MGNNSKGKRGKQKRKSGRKKTHSSMKREKKSYVKEEAGDWKKQTDSTGKNIYMPERKEKQSKEITEPKSPYYFRLNGIPKIK